jgi:hypothetical protein
MRSRVVLRRQRDTERNGNNDVLHDCDGVNLVTMTKGIMKGTMGIAMPCTLRIVEDDTVGISVTFCFARLATWKIMLLD